MNEEPLEKPKCPAGKARLLVVDDHPLLRDGLMQLINRQEDLICCGEAGTAAAARAAIAEKCPDLVVLDLRLGGGDSLELIKSLLAQYSDLRILVVSQFDEALFAERALQAGARGYIMKEQAAAEVLTAIRTVLEGDLYVSRKITAVLLRRSLNTKDHKAAEGLEVLTDRELQVFQMIGSGLATRQIAVELNLSAKTIEAHRENIKRKLGFSNGTELVECATKWVQDNVLPKAPHERSAIWKTEPR